MDFVFEINEKPPPLTVKCTNGATITLQHDYLDSVEKAMAVEAMSGLGFVGAQGTLWQRITAWTGVTNKDGSPLPIRVMEGDKVKEFKLPEVIGRATDWDEQLALVFRQLAANGVRYEKMAETLAQYMPAKKVKALCAEIDDFFSKRGGKAAASSSASASTPA